MYYILVIFVCLFRYCRFFFCFLNCFVVCYELYMIRNLEVLRCYTLFNVDCYKGFKNNESLRVLDVDNGNICYVENVKVKESLLL